ncbi:MAG: 50S ribosomal protein L15 [Candidatus Saccharimonadales bacterium]
MKFHEFQTKPRKSAQRVGRGIAAGRGKTAGRGTKGQGSRTGSSANPGFEGGQNPLMQRLPKLRGFKSHKTPAEVIFTDQLNSLGALVDSTVLADKGLISNPYVTVKLLCRGELTTKVEVKLPQASKTSVVAIQEAGGSFEKTPRLGRPVTRTKKSSK